MLGGTLLTLLLAAPPADYVTDRWDTDRGLPQNTVNAMVQTRDGYLWLATFGGLARFDGVQFTTFTAANTPGLRGSRMIALLEDRDGTLWVGTEADGVARYANGVFTSYDIGQGLPGDAIRALAQDVDGTVWVGTTTGIARWTGERFAAAALPPAIRQPDVLALLADRAGHLWVGTRTGLARLGRGAPRVFRVADGLPDDLVTGLAEEADGTIWISTMQGVVRARQSTLLHENPLPVAGRRGIYRVFETRDAIWISGSPRVLYRCAGSACTDAGASLRADDPARSLLQDREGNLWIGLHIEGLLRLKVPRVRAYAVEGRPRQSIVPIVDDGAGGLWVGATCGGLLHWQNGAFTTYGAKDGVPHDCIWSLHRDHEGALWLGTRGLGAARWKAGTFTYYEYGKSGIVGNSVFSMYRDRRNHLWIGTGAGVSRFDGATFTNYTPADGLPRAVVHFLTGDRAGAIWMGTTAGAVRLQDGRIDRYTTDHGLPHNYVRAIHEDRDGVLWFGTYGGGLARYKDGRFATIARRHGLFDDLVSAIIEDDDGNVWMSAGRGIFRVAKAELNAVADGRATTVTSVTYTTADGMPTNETNGGGQPAGWRTADGRLFFPTVRGLVEIDPRIRDDEPPPVYIERVTGPRLASAFTPGMTLPRGSRDLEFHYTGISLGAPEKVRFQYRLDGYDAAWIDAGDRRAAYYTNVPSGRHSFRVRAMNGDGVWNETGATVAFVIAPYFHETAWFAILAVAALGLAIVGVSRLRVAHLTRRTSELERKVAARTAEVVEQKDRLADANAGLARAHDDLLSVLNQLRVGAVATDHEGRMAFVSATAAPLVSAHGDSTDWAEALPVGAADREQLREMAARPPDARLKLPVRIQSATGRQYWMEIDIKDDPRDPAAKIVFLYDVSEIYDLRLLLDDREHSHGIAGTSAPMQLLQKQIRDVSQVDATVLIEGETGAGKELVARAIHDSSGRRAKPFIAINCAGLTETLLTSQLFGHRRGAFTGATDDQVGLFEAAQHGTLFLDEIGDMPASVQTMLLRVLQEREITRVGESRPRRIDVRVISATHRDLNAEVAAGRFRQDLLFRIRVARILVPPLRKRRQDIPLLASLFLRSASAAADKSIHDISSEAMELLMRYGWPGNVRELKSAIESAAISARGVVLQVTDLPRELQHAASSGARPADTPSPAAIFEGSERQQIEAAIARAGGNRAAAARLLGISRATLYRRLRVLGMDTGSETVP